MSLTRIPTMMEVYEGFPLKAEHLQLDPKRPTAASAKKLMKGFLRSGQPAPSRREGCRGEGMGNRWQAMMVADWDAEHLRAANDRFARDHARWAATRAAIRPEDRATWDAEAANAEPLRADARYDAPAYPVIENPGDARVH